MDQTATYQLDICALLVIRLIWLMFMSATLWIKFLVSRMMEPFVISLGLKLGAMSIIPVINFVQLKMECLASILLLDGT